jgi:hypothetical protein
MTQSYDEHLRRRSPSTEGRPSRGPWFVRRGESQAAPAWLVRSDQRLGRIEIEINNLKQLGSAPRRGTAEQWKAADDAFETAAAQFRYCQGMSLPEQLLTASSRNESLIAAVNVVVESMIPLQDDDSLIASLPALAEQVRRYLSTNDTRRDEYLTFLTNVARSTAGTDLPAITNTTPTSGHANGGGDLA